MLPRRDKAVPFALAVAAFALAFLQRPGQASSDTKIDLHVDPSGFLGEVASLWTPTGSTGHIHGAQHTGYLFPMGPFFALLRELGVSPWVAERLWLGTVLALASWGVVRLLDAMLTRQRGAPHLVAGAITLLNPLVVVFANRTSVFLLSYAALPWVLLAVQRGLREPHSLRWPALIGLVVSASGGGVNAASVAWLMAAPALLLLYEPLVSGIPWRHALRFAALTALAVAVASLWWVVPVASHALYGIDFLQFTEQAGTIWSTTSLPESLRLMGYWISYLGVGYGGALEPYFSDSPTLLFEPLVVVATLAVPGLAIAGLALTRRWRYAPFFLALLLLGVLAMAAGFPEGSPLRRALTFAYNRVDAVQFLRTTYKAGPLVAIAVACLAGAAWGELASRLRVRRLALGLAAAASAALIALSAWPFFTGDALDEQVLWERIPPAWTDAAKDIDRELPRNERAVVLPGQAFAFYRWGATVDPILPALSKRPVAVRNTPPYADMHAVDVLWTVDGLVQQERLVPGQLPPLLDLMAVGTMVAGSDDRSERSGAIPPADAARALSRQPGTGRAAAAYGARRNFEPRPEELEPPVALPEVRRYDYPGGRGLVRVQPEGRPTVVDGSAEALAGLAAFGQLPGRSPILYAGDSSAAEVRRAAARGAELVVSDSNRRRVFVASRTRQTTGATLGPGEEIPVDAALLDPFPERGSEAQTVALYSGARTVTAPLSPGFSQFPEQRPFAAFDGDPETAWLADPSLEPERHWVEAVFDRRRAVTHVNVLPYDDPRVRVTEVGVAGKRFRVRPGWNRLRLDAPALDRLRVEVLATDPPKEETDSAGGIAEVRVPGLRVRERLRSPRLVTGALSGVPLSRSGLTYLFSRTTADTPFRRERYPAPPAAAGARSRTEAEADLVRGARDPERALSRSLELPAKRSFEADAWVSPDTEAPDSLLDRLASTAGDAHFESSSRYRNLAAHRASRAFDGDRATGWIGGRAAGSPTWVSWETAAPAAVERLQMLPPAAAVPLPTQVRVRWPGGVTPPLTVPSDGVVKLPAPVSARNFRLEVLDTRLPLGAPSRARSRAAVGIGELRGRGVPRARSAPRLAASVAGRCGDASLTVGGRQLALRPDGSVRDLERGVPLRARGCGPAASLPAGRHLLRSAEGRLLVDHLSLRSPAPAPLAVPAASAGRVEALGDWGPGSYEGVRVRLREPAWLVLGESYNRGWRASCDDRDLGEPRVVDGFANGWRAPRDCRRVELDYAPQRALTAGFAVSGVGGLVLLALVIAGGVRARRGRAKGPAASELLPAGGPAAPESLPAGDRPGRLTPGRAIAVGLVAVAVFGFVFALRAGVVIGPALALLLWRGVGVRPLVLAAGGLLAIVVPALYLFFPPEDRGGYNTEYALQLLGAHWVSVAAVVLLALALWRMLSTARAPSGGRAGGRAAAGRGPTRA